MRKAPQHDKALYDHIKEIWEAWDKGQDDFLDPMMSFDDMLKGYFICYYKGEPQLIPEAIKYFDKEINEWENEDDRLTGDDSFDDLPWC